MKHDVTDTWLKKNEGAMNNLDNEFSLSYQNRHLQRRENLRCLIKKFPYHYKVMGQMVKNQLEELCTPEDKNLHRDRMTRFITALAPFMGGIHGCKAGRDKSDEYGYNIHHALRGVFFAYCSKVGVKPEDAFDVLSGDYVVVKEVKAKYKAIDDVLTRYGKSLKHFFHHIGVGPWEGGCVVCRLVDLKQVKNANLSGDLDSIHLNDWLGALKVLCPKLFAVVSLEEAHAGNGIRRDPVTDDVGDVLLCPITQVVVAEWDRPFDIKFPRTGNDDDDGEKKEEEEVLYVTPFDITEEEEEEEDVCLEEG
jgi:hypothetical protein